MESTTLAITRRDIHSTVIWTYFPTFPSETIGPTVSKIYYSPRFPTGWCKSSPCCFLGYVCSVNTRHIFL